MILTDFANRYAEEALALAAAQYEEERTYVPDLPAVDKLPSLEVYIQNGLGVAAVENGRLVGYLCCTSPFDNAFRSTHVKGVFSPMGINAAKQENRAGIYAAMYQAAGEKWVRTGAVSHAICLYTHDHEAQRQMNQYGFGMRCVDAIRPMTAINCEPCDGYELQELAPADFTAVLPLAALHDAHFRQSPTFMSRETETPAAFMEHNRGEAARYFTASYHGELCAYLKITNQGETFITLREDSRHIGGAYCLPAHRGRGVYQNLLDFAISALHKDGYTRLGVDFESINPAAYKFWLKYFSAYTFGVVRRIDERILETSTCSAVH